MRRPSLNASAVISRPHFILIAFAVIVLISSNAPSRVAAQGLRYAGIPAGEMDYFASEQRNFQWCWAASIQMVLNYYGIDIVQEQIVTRTYGKDAWGRAPDLGGTLEAIMSNLNQRGRDNRGRSYSVQSRAGKGAPEPLGLLQELSRGKPIILAYSNGPGNGHVAVLEGAVFEPSAYGPVIRSLFVRDPWPSRENLMHRGLREYSGSELASRVHFYWYTSSMWTPEGRGPLPNRVDREGTRFERIAGGTAIPPLGGRGLP